MQVGAPAPAPATSAASSCAPPGNGCDGPRAHTGSVKSKDGGRGSQRQD